MPADHPREGNCGSRRCASWWSPTSTNPWSAVSRRSPGTSREAWPGAGTTSRWSCRARLAWPTRHRRAGQRHLPRLIALAMVRRHAARLPASLRGGQADGLVRARRGPHSFPGNTGGHGRIGAARRSVPVVYTNHYLPANIRPSAAPRSAIADAFFYRYIVGFSNKCSYVTAPTATALGLLRERGLRVPSRVISNGADLHEYSPGPADGQIRHRYGLPAGRPLILSAGRLSPEKRMDVLLDAAARLSPTRRSP